MSDSQYGGRPHNSGRDTSSYRADSRYPQGYGSATNQRSHQPTQGYGSSSYRTDDHAGTGRASSAYSNNNRTVQGRNTATYQADRRNTQTSGYGTNRQTQYQPRHSTTEQNTRMYHPTTSHTERNAYDARRYDQRSTGHSQQHTSREELEQRGKQPPPSNHGKQPKKKKKKKKRGKLSKILLVLLLLFVVVVGGAVIGTVLGILKDTQTLNTDDVMPQSYTTIVYDDKGNEVDKLYGSENREYVNLEEIPQDLQDAVVAIEDERFYEHGGIDIRGIFRAMVENIKSMSFKQGASTITQQLIKNEALSAEKSLVRKIKEQYLAINLESELKKQLGSKEAAKKYVLELYLNTIALSHGLNGVESASQYYFGKHVSDLTLAECASIAAITNNPSKYAPDTNPEYNKERQTLVLNKMLECGFITQSEHTAAKAEDIYANLVCDDQKSDTDGEAKHNYFVEAMIDQLADDLQGLGYTSAQAYKMIYNNGLEIHMTMDANMQNILDQTFTDDNMFPPSDGMLDVTYLISVMDTTKETKDANDTSNQSHYERKTSVRTQEEIDAFVKSVKDELLDDTHVLVLDNLTVSKSLQSAMVIMDQSNGQVKAVVGGRGEKPGDSVFNRATQGLRQQGSAMKILASYAPAIDLGLLMPGSVIVDEPVQYGSWAPKNWQGRFFGPMTVREGIRDSMNILAVKTFMEVGAQKSFDYMTSMGLEHLTEEDKAATTALGGLTQGVSVLEMTSAYATIANGGTYYQPVYYSVVYDHDGKVLIDNRKREGDRVLKETTAYLLTDMMKDVITGGTGTAARVPGMTIAGKTGTTNDSVDLTFYAYSPYYTAGIWMGYDNSKPMNDVSGSAHLKIWRHVMSKIHENLPDKDFTKPDGIVSYSVCAATGDAPSSLCSQDYYGYTTSSDIAASDFKSSRKTCTAHQSFTICKESGHLAGENCPEEYRVPVVLAVNGTQILGKPSDVSGKMDIDISQTCSIDHTAGVTETPEEESPNASENGETHGNHGTTPEGTIPQTGEGDGEDTETEDIETEDIETEENFGIQ